MIVLHVLQFDLMDHAVGRVLALWECEVQYTYRVDIFKMIVPLALGNLLTDGVGGVVDAAVLEVKLLCLLHLDDDAATVCQTAIDIKDGLAVYDALAQVLGIHVGEVGDLGLVVEQRIEETDQQILVQFRAEQLLEPKVGVRVDVPLADFHFHFLFLLLLRILVICAHT